MFDYDFYKEVLAIVIGVGLWDGSVLLFQWWQKHLAKSVKCDICEKPKKTSLTKDKKMWACRKCRPLYNKENSL